MAKSTGSLPAFLLRTGVMPRLVRGIHPAVWRVTQSREQARPFRGSPGQAGG